MSKEEINIHDLFSEAGRHLRNGIEQIKLNNHHYAESGKLNNEF